jgi:hypothetical protein
MTRLLPSTETPPYRLGLLCSIDPLIARCMYRRFGLYNCEVVGFISLAPQESNGLLWHRDCCCTHRFLELRDATLDMDRAVSLTVSSHSLQFELDGRLCSFPLDAQGCIDSSFVSDCSYSSERVQVRLRVAKQDAIADITLEEMCMIGGGWGLTFLPVARS